MSVKKYVCLGDRRQAREFCWLDTVLGVNTSGLKKSAKSWRSVALLVQRTKRLSPHFHGMGVKERNACLQIIFFPCPSNERTTEDWKWQSLWLRNRSLAELGWSVGWMDQKWASLLKLGLKRTQNSQRKTGFNWIHDWLCRGSIAKWHPHFRQSR